MPRLPTLISILALLVGCTLSGARAQERPNLISIVTDDQGVWTVGAYGNRESRTPNIDRLAAEGARFTNAFTCTPVCSPSRASFLTGRYGTQLSITDYLSPAEEGAGLGLPPDAMTWPKVLQRQGYRTALIGKWHLGSQPRFHPTSHGFNHFYGFLGGGTQPMDPTFEVDGKARKLTGAEPDLVMDEALRWVREQKDRPFALLLHFRAPHLPYGPVPDADTAPFQGLDPTVPSFKGLDLAQVKQLTRAYYASIHSVDRNLGRLDAVLTETGLARKTIVMFQSDHGYNLGHHGIHTKGNGFWMAGGVNGPKRPNMWDTSLRIPLVIRWPGVVRPGTVIEELVSTLDTYSSVLGMLGVPAPPEWRQQGRDYAPLLRGEKAQWREELYGQYDLHNLGLAYMRMIRTDRWKLVRHYHANGLDELYDLTADPGEERNLYNQPAQRQAREELQAGLDEWMRRIKDPLAPRGPG